MDDVTNGNDVEIRSVRNGTGHVAMVTGITKHNDGSYTIEVIQELRQDGQ
jgi:hypothetical protein